MRVPLLDLKQQLVPLREDILAAVAELIDSTGYILGPKVEIFEKEVASYCQARHGIGVSSGTDALLAALMGLGIGPGDLVLTTPYSFIATLGCILRLGAKPVFADIDPQTYNIDPVQVAQVLDDQKYNNKIKAIIPVHLYGQCADMGPLLKLASQHDIPVVEDAAQAIGASYPMNNNGAIEWRRAGSMGDAGCFSFFPSKNLGGIGDGGMITLADDDLAEKIRIIRVHGGKPKYHHAVIGGNFRLDPIQAVTLSIKLPHLPEWHRARRTNAALYDSLFAESGLVADGLVELPFAAYAEAARIKPEAPDYHIYNQYIVRVKQRDQLKEYLTRQNIVTEVYYPIPLHKQKCLAEMGCNDLSFPEAERAAAQTLALPIFPELNDEMQQYVVEKIHSFYE